MCRRQYSYQKLSDTAHFKMTEKQKVFGFYNRYFFFKYITYIVVQDEDLKILLNLRVRSWLRTNAGGRPEACKSNEKGSNTE